MMSTMTDEPLDGPVPGSRLFVPSDEQRRMVKVMSGFGIPQPDIAGQIGIDAKTLRKHFREELDRGMTEANMRVAQSLFNMATTGGNVAAAIFWMKARAGWREKHEVAHTGADGEPLRFVIHAGYPEGEELSPESWVAKYRPASPLSTAARIAPTIDADE